MKIGVGEGDWKDSSNFKKLGSNLQQKGFMGTVHFIVSLSGIFLFLFLSRAPPEHAEIKAVLPFLTAYYTRVVQ